MSTIERPLPPRPDFGPPPAPSRSAATRRLVVALVAGAVATDLAARAHWPSAALVVLVAVLGIGALAAAPTRRGSAVAAIVAAIGLAAVAATSTSPWRTGPNLAAIAALLAVGAGLGVGPGTVPTFGDLARRLLRPVARSWRTPRLVAFVLAPMARATSARVQQAAVRGGAPERVRQAASVARGLLLATPVVVGIALLLRAADPVFASFLDVPLPQLDVLGAADHVALLVLGAAVTAALLVAATDPVAPRPVARRPLGSTEAIVVLGGLTTVYALFAASQVLVALGGADHVLRTNGLTSAEYARSGFFQLLWASGLTLVVLLGVRGATRSTTRRAWTAVASCSVAASLLTLLVVATAIHRLDVYQQAYGLTMLRLTCSVFAWWLGLVFVLLAVRMVTPAPREWLPLALLASAVLGVFAFNGIDPEAHVVRTNVDRAVEGRPFDTGYLAHLSDDAVPALVAALPRLDPQSRQRVLATICADRSDRPEGWPSANRSRWRATAARTQACG